MTGLTCLNYIYPRQIALCMGFFHKVLSIVIISVILFLHFDHPLILAPLLVEYSSSTKKFSRYTVCNLLATAWRLGLHITLILQGCTYTII
jgi:hypothetical protein